MAELINTFENSEFHFPAVKIMAAVSGNTIGMKHREARISSLGFLIMIFRKAPRRNYLFRIPRMHFPFIQIIFQRLHPE